MKVHAITDQATFDRWVAEKKRVPRQGLEYTGVLKKLIKNGVPCHIVNANSEPVYRIKLSRNEELVKVKM